MKTGEVLVRYAVSKPTDAVCCPIRLAKVKRHFCSYRAISSVAVSLAYMSRAALPNRPIQIGQRNRRPLPQGRLAPEPWPDPTGRPAPRTPAGATAVSAFGAEMSALPVKGT